MFSCRHRTASIRCCRLPCRSQLSHPPLSACDLQESPFLIILLLLPFLDWYHLTRNTFCSVHKSSIPCCHPRNRLQLWLLFSLMCVMYKKPNPLGCRNCFFSRKICSSEKWFSSWCNQKTPYFQCW